MTTPATPPPKSKSRAGFIMWLVVFSLGALIIPLYLTSSTLQQDTTALEEELVVVQATLNSNPPIDREEQQLRDNLAVERDKIRALEPMKSTLTARHVNWASVMAVLNNYNQSLMSLISLVQNENLVIITGRADKEATVIAYQQTLEASNQFSRIVVQSMSLAQLPTPTLTPTPTPTSTPTPDPSATPSTSIVPTSTPAPLPTPETVIEFVILVEVKGSLP